MIYLDSNIFIIAANRNDERQKTALKLLEMMENSDINCCTSVLTIDEVVWGISNIVGKKEAKKAWKSLTEEPNLELISLEELDVVSAKSNFPDLDPRDCLHLQAFKKSKSDFLVTEDNDFDQLTQVRSVRIKQILDKF